MRILLDECVDQRLRRKLNGHNVSTAQECGWAGKKNGELLRLAQEQFQAFVTVDRNLYFQQNLAKFDVAVFILSSPTNHFSDLQSLIPRLLVELSTAKKNQVVIISEKSL